MGKTVLLVLIVAITMIKLFKGEPNLACSDRGGYCSDSNTCTSLGGHVEKLSTRCKCGNACCQCFDTCPEGSTCMSEGGTCDGTKVTNGCCGNRFCCTPDINTTPASCVSTCSSECMNGCIPGFVRDVGDCCGSQTCCVDGGR